MAATEANVYAISAHEGHTGGERCPALPTWVETETSNYHF
jgi:hypothetical protein